MTVDHPLPDQPSFASGARMRSNHGLFLDEVAMLPTPAIAALCEKFPLITELMALQPLSWFNPRIAPAAEALKDVGLTADVAQASARMRTRSVACICRG